FLNLRPEVVIVEARHENLSAVGRNFARPHRDDLRCWHCAANLDRRLTPTRGPLRVRGRAVYDQRCGEQHGEDIAGPRARAPSCSHTARLRRHQRPPVTTLGGAASTLPWTA